MGIKQINSRQVGIISNHLHLQVEIYMSIWIVQRFKIKRVLSWPFLLPRKSLYSNFSEHLSTKHRKILSLDKSEDATIFLQSRRCMQNINEWVYRKKSGIFLFLLRLFLQCKVDNSYYRKWKNIHQPQTAHATSKTWISELVYRNIAYVCQNQSYNDNPLKASLEVRHIFQPTVLRN